MLRYAVSAIAFLVVFSGGLAPVFAEKRVALVIGNASYKHQPQLINASRDAEAIADSLRDLGFSVVRLERDLGRDVLRHKLIAFGDEAANADWALVYYAGHGIEMGGTNYVVPVDAQLKRDKHVRIEAVPLNEILEAVESASKLRLVILDACRNNPFLASIKRSRGRTRAIGRGLARIEPNKGTLVAYAARHGQVASDGDGKNSPYVSALLKHLSTPGLEISLMFRRVRDSVLKLTNGGQEPFTYGSLPGVELYFKREDNTVQSEPVPSVATIVPDRDDIVWAAISSSVNRGDFAFYLRQFPDGKHIDKARAKLASLTIIPERPPEKDPKDRENVTDPATIKDAQQRLYELNYEPGSADGRSGPLLAQAIKDFQTDANLSPDGALTRGLLKRLQSAGTLKPWGAIVYSPSSGNWGMAWGEETRTRAVAAAQKTCTNQCDKELSFFKGWCGAFAHADQGWSLSSRSSIEEARKQSLASCKSQATDCRILAAVCAGGSHKFVSAN